MNVNTGIWDKVTQTILIITALVMLGGVAVWYLPLIQQNKRMRQELAGLDHEIAMQSAIAERSKIEIEAIQTDPRTIERLARERLGYAKPGETVIRFQAVEADRD
jgi:cell division protein FtsB